MTKPRLQELHKRLGQSAQLSPIKSVTFKQQAMPEWVSQSCSPLQVFFTIYKRTCQPTKLAGYHDSVPASGKPARHFAHTALFSGWLECCKRNGVHRAAIKLQNTQDMEGGTGARSMPITSAWYVVFELAPSHEHSNQGFLFHQAGIAHLCGGMLS